MTGLSGAVVLIAGAGVLVIAAWGVVVLPDALARQHAATKAGTFALALVCTGAMLMRMDTAWTWRLLLILGFLVVTLPVASHMLARAAVREAGLDDAVDGAPLISGDPDARELTAGAGRAGTVQPPEE